VDALGGLGESTLSKTSPWCRVPLALCTKHAQLSGGCHAEGSDSRILLGALPAGAGRSGRWSGGRAQEQKPAGAPGRRLLSAVVGPGGMLNDAAYGISLALSIDATAFRGSPIIFDPRSAFMGTVTRGMARYVLWIRSSPLPMT